MFGKTGLLIPLLLVILAACSQAPTPEADVSSQLAPMFGTSGVDEATGLASNDLGVYVVGNTNGSLHGTHKGGRDVFIRKETQYSQHLWGRQFGTSSHETATGVASDSNYNAYVVGYTGGNLGVKNRGKADAFIRKYDPGGGIVWSHQFGTSGYDYANSVASYGSSIYVVGTTEGPLARNNLGSWDAYILKLNAADSRVAWSSQFGSRSYDVANDVAVDASGNVYVVGDIAGQMFIRKYSPSGLLLWDRRVSFGSTQHGKAVAVWGNSVYLVGEYTFSTNYDDTIVAVTKFTTAGLREWSNSYGGYGYDYINDASVDSYGYLYFAGRTLTSFAGTNQGNFDGYVVKVSHNGYHTPLWRKTMGTPKFDSANAVLARPLGTRTCAIAISDSCNQIYVAGLWGYDTAFLGRLDSANGSNIWLK